MQLRTDYNSWGFLGGAMKLGESSGKFNHITKILQRTTIIC